MLPTKSSIRLVAERAKVSHATVSRVLNNADVRIAPETRLRVERAASELGYQPNHAARALVTGRTQTIAMWTIDLRTAYYGDFIHYAHQEIVSHGYNMIVSESRPGKDGALDMSNLFSWPVDGILSVDLPRGAIPGMQGSLVGGLPFVNVGGYVREDADYVFVDFREQSAEAVRHLAAIGCRRIAYMVPDWFDWFHQNDDSRLGGYDRAVAGLGRGPEYIRVPNGLRESVGPVLPDYIKRHDYPDGIFCYNDDLAIGAFAALRDLGLRVPEDVALIGCDGLRETEYLRPALSTIRQPLAQMCAEAWSLLARRIQDPELPLQKVVLAPVLELRGSSLRTP